MQEEIEQKSFNIMISTTKLSARTVLNAVKAAIRLYQSKASQGKQSVRTLLRQNRGVSSVEISKTGIKGFERYAKKYGIDYAIRKDSSEVPPKYLVFFKAPDAEAFQSAFKEYSASLLSKSKLAAGKTAKSILISCGARLAPFDIQELRDRTMYDELELDMLGDRKTALFLIMSDTDSTFNFLISMVYTQLFNLLCDKADDKYGGKLPVHVRCLIDECANIGQIPNLEKLVATIRSRELSACLVLQARSQLKAIYKDNADTIVGNMDSQIFLGGSEPTTLKELSETLGKETIDSFNTSDTRGNSPSYGTSFQKLGHELMSRDELAVLDGGKCILQLRGVRPFLSDKYDLTQHPNYKLTSDYDPKNTFDIEKYLNRKEKIQPGDEFFVLDADSLPPI